ncbi:GumC family protein [Aerosakkonema funiforme]|uniref:GumC family protein n=1 Tax=Aerosakkonema funiforme TaxID=1246630 RepID=UPI0035B7503D
MTQLLTIPQSSSKSAVQPTWPFYLAAGIAINAAIWGLALVYLKVKSPSYTSDFAISLPVANSSTNVTVPGIGQASASSESPYLISSQDPRENYKFLLTSREVMKEATKDMNMSGSEFGQPRVTTIANTTIMKVELSGDSPAQAQQKTSALLKALQTKIIELRNKQVDQQDELLKNTLLLSENKLKAAQQRLSEYKANSILNSADQIKELTNTIEQLRKQRSEAIAQQQQANARAAQLTANLNLSAKQAGDAFSLQTDPVILKSLQDYSASNAALISLNAKFLPNHPAVIDEMAKRDAAQAALLNRASTLLGRSVSLVELNQLNLNNTQSTSAKTALSQDLVTAQAEQEGFQAQAQALDRQIVLLENRLKTLAQKESTLASLERDVRTAEAVFSSTLARLDLGKSTVSAAYPQIQVFSEPSLPQVAASPKKIFVLAGAALGSVFCTNAVVLLWLRQRQKRSAKRVDSIPSETTHILTTVPEVLELASKGNSSNGKRG